MALVEDTRSPLFDSHDYKGQDTNDAPPAYTASRSLALVKGGQAFPQQTLQMVGDSRNPDFTIGTSTQPGPLFTIETESTQVYHETSVKSPQPGFTNFFMKRKVNGDQWMYTVEMGKRKVLEFESRPNIEKVKTKLVFRNVCEDELDALYMQPTGDEGSFEVLHRDERVGSIKNLGSNRTPEYELKALMPGVDPILLVILAVVLDDRSMTSRRRLRRPLASGWTGVGKGPGAGLAGAYAVFGGG